MHHLRVEEQKERSSQKSMKASIYYLSFALFLMMIYASSSSSPRNPLATTSSKVIIMSSNSSSSGEACTKTNHTAHHNHNNSTITRYITIKFEVSGKVQGVFFRKYTKAKADELGLTGWCRNTPRGTVQGEFEYASSSSADDNNTDKVESWEAMAFQNWLCRVGSPRSRIDECTFTEGPTSVGARKFDTFRVIR
jgi:acylphosphatase